MPLKKRFATAFIAGLSLFAFTDSARSASPSATARQALNRIVPDMNLTGVTLGDAIEFIRDITNSNVHVEWPALEAAGVTKETPINIHLRGVALRKVLSLLLSESTAGAPLTFYVDEGVIEITTRELADKQMITRLYPVDDLIMEVPDFVGPDFNIQTNNSSAGGSGGGGGSSGGSQGPFSGGSSNSNDNKGQTRAERAKGLIDTIEAVIQPDIWKENGGTAAIRFFQGSLIVTAPRSVHEALGGPVD